MTWVKFSVTQQWNSWKFMSWFNNGILIKTIFMASIDCSDFFFLCNMNSIEFNKNYICYQYNSVKISFWAKNGIQWLVSFSLVNPRSSLQTADKQSADSFWTRKLCPLINKIQGNVLLIVLLIREGTCMETVTDLLKHQNILMWIS